MAVISFCFGNLEVRAFFYSFAVLFNVVHGDLSRDLSSRYLLYSYASRVQLQTLRNTVKKQKKFKSNPTPIPKTRPPLLNLRSTVNYTRSPVCPIILYILIRAMSLLDDLDEKLNHHSLDLMLGSSPQHDEPSELLCQGINDLALDENCVTYQWFWKDEDPVQEPVEELTPIVEEVGIDDMKNARAAQEEKVKQFLSKIKPINTMVRKASLEEKTEAGSPKKKKIKKMFSFK